LVVNGSPGGEEMPLGLLDALVVMDGDGEPIVGEGELAVGTFLTHAVRAQKAIRAAAAIFTSISNEIQAGVLRQWHWNAVCWLQFRSACN
jgi:hypothetical protein